MSAWKDFMILRMGWHFMAALQTNSPPHGLNNGKLHRRVQIIGGNLYST